MFLSVTPLKVGLQIRGVARVPDDSLAKSTNGLLLVCNRPSIVRGKTKVLPNSVLYLEAWFHDLVEFVYSRHLYTHRQRVSYDYLLLCQIIVKS